ncbi:MAG TPA: hypothetical protein VJ922_01880 [Actinomycetota bacterium]|nr:hypothetical protein [Actinomycetota bacterium]
MARSYLNMVDEAGDQALSALGKAQEAVVSAVSTASERIADVLPDLPKNPIADNVPTPRETTKTGFDLAEKFLGAAKDYSLELLKALEPLTTKTFWNTSRKTKKAAASTKAA